MIRTSRLRRIEERECREIESIYFLYKDVETGKEYEARTVCQGRDLYRPTLGKLLCRLKIDCQFLKDIRKNELIPKLNVLKGVERTLMRTKDSDNDKAIKIVKKMRLDVEKELNQIHEQLRENYLLLEYHLGKGTVSFTHKGDNEC